MTLQLEIVTPEKIVLSEIADEVIVPTETGEIAILPNHVPLFTKVTHGELKVKKGQTEHSFAITGGFLQLAKNKITILADHAIRADEIEIAKAEEAKKRAQKLIDEKLSDEDFAVVQGDLQRALLQLRVAFKHKEKRGHQ